MTAIRRQTVTAVVVAVLAAGATHVAPAAAQDVPTTSSSTSTSTALVPDAPPATALPAPPVTDPAPGAGADDPTTALPPTTGAPEVAAPPEAARTVSGTIRGIDGRFVNAQISVVLVDSQLRTLRLDGSLQPNQAIYATTISMNPRIPLEGADQGDATWSFAVPANAYAFTFEIYPRGPQDPQGNWSHYGGASKRRVIIPGPGLAGVRLRLPLNCDVPGGNTGSIEVHNTTNGAAAGGLRNFLALSENNPPSGIQGFRALGPIPAGDASPSFDGLAPGQRYSVNITDSAGRLHAFYEVPVHACQTTHIYSHVGTVTTPPRWGTVAVSQRGTYFPIVGEFSGDRRADVFWYSPSGPGDNLAISAGGTGSFTTQPRTIGAGFRPVAGDFDADGLDDIFWYGPGAAPDRLWRGGQGGAFTSVPASAAGNTDVWPVAGDFDGNGHSDILFAEGGHLSTVRRYTADGYTNGAARVPANSAVRSGDIDGDGRDDLVWYDSDTGRLQVWFGRADGTFSTLTDQIAARQGYRPILADLSGDFRADVLWYGPGATADTIWRGRAQSSPRFARESANLGINGNYQPFAGDFNGDGTEDIYWYGPGTAADSLWRMNLSGWIPQAAP